MTLFPCQSTTLRSDYDKYQAEKYIDFYTSGAIELMDAYMYFTYINRSITNFRRIERIVVVIILEAFNSMVYLVGLHNLVGRFFVFIHCGI